MAGNLCFRGLGRTGLSARARLASGGSPSIRWQTTRPSRRLLPDGRGDTRRRGPCQAYRRSLRRGRPRPRARLPATPLRRAHREPRPAHRGRVAPPPMTSVKRVAIVHRDLNLLGSLGRDAFLLVRELVDLGIDVHVYCNPATRAPHSTGRPSTTSVHSSGRPHGQGAHSSSRSFAAAATRTVHADARRCPYDIVDVNSVSAWGQDVVRVHEVVRAAQRRWSSEAGAGRRFARAHAAVAPLPRPELGVRRTIQRLQFRPGGTPARSPCPRRCATTSSRSSACHPTGSSSFRSPPPSTPSRPTPGRASATGSASRGTSCCCSSWATRSAARDYPGRSTRWPDCRPTRASPSSARPATASCAKRSVAPSRRASRSGSISSAATRRRGTTPPPTCSSSRPRTSLWGIPVIEAMASGLPVVTTRAAGSAVGAGARGRRPRRSTRRAARPASGRPRRAALPTRPSRKRWASTAASPRQRFTARARAELTLAAYERFGTPPAASRAPSHRAARHRLRGSRRFPPSSR